MNGATAQGIDAIYTYLRDATGSQIAVQNDTNADGNTDNISFSHVKAALNMTAWDSDKLADVGDKLNYITLSNTTASTTLTLNKATIAAISQTGFQVRGDATDTVNLTDITSAEKLSATTTVSGQNYNQYQFEVEGNTYTLLVDTDINVVLG